MVYSFSQSAAASPHKVQYFEILGNRAIYADGWLAGTVHRAPWDYKPRATFADDTWELYDTRGDFSLANDLAASNPGKLKDMQALFHREAVKYRVLPLDDRTFERFNPVLAGRPDLLQGRTSLTLYPGMVGMSENVFIDVKNRSISITADLDRAGEASGVILAQGGRFGGWTLYLKEGRPFYEYNYLGLKHFVVKGDGVLSKGATTLRLDFAYDGGGAGKGGVARLMVNGKAFGQGRIDQTQPAMFSADETADVGEDDATPVSSNYGEGGTHFTGVIGKIVVEVKRQGIGDKETSEEAGSDSRRKKAE